MKRTQRFTCMGLILGLLLGLPILGQTEENGSGDTDLMTIAEFREAIHFYNPDGADIVIGPGAYSVTSEKDGILRLESRSDKTLYILKAEPGTHKESLQQPVAVTVYGDVVDEPDISVLTLLLPGGTQLSAEGSYSGIRPRGLRDRLEAAQNRLQGAAQEARRRAEVRKKEFQIRADLSRQVLAMPNLSPTQKAQLRQMGETIREQHKGLIVEILRRINNNRPLITYLQRKGDQELTDADIGTFFSAIIGAGPDSLRLATWPQGDLEAKPDQPTTRGLGDNGISWSLGTSLSGASVVGAAIGGYYGMAPLPPPAMLIGRSRYISATGSLGFQGGISGNLDIGFWNFSSSELDGCLYGVGGGITAGPGLGVSVWFQGIPATGNFRFAGLVISPSVGAEGGVAAIAGTCGKKYPRLM